MANKKKSLSINITVDGLKETEAALKKLPPEALEGLIDASWEISQDLAKRIRIAARSQGPQAALLAGTVSTDEKTKPAVTIGGSSKVGRKKKPAFKVLFGAEFGATYLPQFRARNTGGYFIYPTVNEMSDDIAEKWLKAANDAVDNFGRG